MNPIVLQGVLFHISQKRIRKTMVTAPIPAKMSEKEISSIYLSLHATAIKTAAIETNIAAFEKAIGHVISSTLTSASPYAKSHLGICILSFAIYI